MATPDSNFVQVCYSNLTYSGPTSDLTQGHIHNGTAGVAGPVVVPLFTGVPPATACTPADPASIAAIVAAPGGALTPFPQFPCYLVWLLIVHQG